MLLVHGFGGDKNSWLFVQEPLAEDRATVHALDLPGHGASDKDVGDGSLETLAAVIGFLDALGVARHISWGTRWAARWSPRWQPSRRRRKVASLTLLAPAGFGPEIDADYLRGFAEAKSRRELKPPARAVRRSGTGHPPARRRSAQYKRLDGVDQALRSLVQTLSRATSPLSTSRRNWPRSGDPRSGLGPRRQDRACRERSRSGQSGHPVDAPHTHIATVRVDPAHEAALLRSVTDGLPNVTGIRVADVLAAISALLDQIANALAATGLLTLLAGLLVLVSAVSAGQRRRTREAIILRGWAPPAARSAPPGWSSSRCWDSPPARSPR